ncbi:methyltransferase domain-containing protein [Thermoclostridium stercorarium]|uniref:methyltransferase domain-containing protein n=1 Tax=Thermoclostridium stercorarium TaxID=1510 RepID=UPI002248CF4F|nr:methyltransferase domain-containing protein [Thermoclostridium stercorarium]UZQ85127.1 methyltransferase domain-containing protein [Thermoclostridium stercorarium]
MEKEILNMDEAAELFGVSVKTFIKLLREEDVPARKIGREWRFSRKALIEWLAGGSSKMYSASEQEIRQFFEDIADRWEEISSGLYDNSIVNKLIDSNLLNKDITVLDYGCGDGFISRGIASHVGKVIAMDMSVSMLDELDRKAKLQGITNILTVECEESEVPLRDGRIDLVCASMILHHVESPRNILKEFSRVLRPSGIIFIADLLPHEDEGFQEKMHDRHRGINPAELERWLLDAGFGNISMEKLPASNGNKKDIFVLTAVKMMQQGIKE